MELELQPAVTMWRNQAAHYLAALEEYLTCNLDAVLPKPSSTYDRTSRAFITLPQPDDGRGYAPGGLKHQALMRYAREVRALQVQIRHTFHMIEFCRRYRILHCSAWIADDDDLFGVLPATMPATNGRPPKPHLSNGMPIEDAIRGQLVLLRDEFLRRENLILEELLPC